MRSLTREEIVLSFDVKYRKKIKLPNLDKVNWDMLDFLGWIHPSGHLGFVVFDVQGCSRGFVLEKTQAKKMHKVSAMCSLCLTVHNSSGVALFSLVSRINPRSTIGWYICADLGCSLNVRGINNISASQMGETISMEDKILRLTSNLEKLFSRILES